jgi:hypothetical protein
VLCGLEGGGNLLPRAMTMTRGFYFIGDEQQSSSSIYHHIWFKERGGGRGVHILLDFLAFLRVVILFNLDIDTGVS